MNEIVARAILEAAIREERCGELLDCLFANGGCTIDAVTRRLVLITAGQLEAATPP